MVALPSKTESYLALFLVSLLSYSLLVQKYFELETCKGVCRGLGDACLCANHVEEQEVGIHGLWLMGHAFAQFGIPFHEVQLICFQVYLIHASYMVKMKWDCLCFSHFVFSVDECFKIWKFSLQTHWNPIMVLVLSCSLYNHKI